MTLRQEMHSYIDDISENMLIVLKPLLSALVNDSIIIESNLTNDERLLIAQGMTEYENNPESFVSLKNIN